METMKNNCTGMESKLADLLLDPDAVPAKVRVHVEQCDHCQGELAELHATMALLDTWEEPEPSPYFLTRLDARMREERQAEPAGLAGAPARPLRVWPVDACAAAGGDGADGDAAGGWRSVSGRLGLGPDRPATPGRLPWCTICRRWITTRSCWTRWKPCRRPPTTAETEGSAS
jgi:hypothetical protein